MRAKARFFSLIIFIFFIQIILVSVAAAATRIMPLGDSITRGTTDPNPPDPNVVGYRQTLYLDLTDEGYDVDFVGGVQGGGSAVPAFDIDHEGHGGWEADEIVNGNSGDLGAGALADWLAAHEPDIVLLHIGTNDISDGETPADIVSQVELILDEIFAYDTKIVVILAQIINQNPYSQATTDFNNLLPDMVDFHPQSDNIFVVDHESALTYPGDLVDNVHPNMTGYSKMADVWFDTLENILPEADAGSNQSVDEGETVTLDGSNSNDPPFNPISDYFWEQTGGKPVTISDPAVVQPTFTAPDAGSQGETLTFRLTVNYSDNFESSDTTIVMVNGHSSSSSSGGCFIGTAAYYPN